MPQRRGCWGYMLEIGEIAKLMREHGVRRAVFSGGVVAELELFDTIPAPAPALEPTDAAPLEETEPKPPGMCIALGCSEDNGWHFDKRFCAAHGRAAAGVRL